MRKKRHSKPGTPPGELTALPEAHVPHTLHVIRYTPETVEEADVASVDELAPHQEAGGILWVNVDGLGSVDLVRALGKFFGLHPLALEDAMNVGQRPKVDAYDSHLFLVVRMPHFDEALSAEQVSIFLGPSFVVTFQERPGDCFEPIRVRLRSGTGRLRREGADFLTYAIVDAIVDHYFPTLEKLSDVIEDLDDEVLESPTRRTVGRVRHVKRELLELRRSVWPLREMLNALARTESDLVGEATRLYLRDCYDHAVQVLDVVETYRELAGGLMDVYLSSLSNRMNEVMKVLTIIATIFIPLTFVAGIYGMNFEKMPELKWRWGYPLVWAVMITLAVLMLAAFRRRGWLGGREGGAADDEDDEEPRP